MLSRFASTVETLNDNECTSRALRHIFLCSVSVNRPWRSLQVLWVVYEQLRRAGLGRHLTQCAAALASTLLQGVSGLSISPLVSLNHIKIGEMEAILVDMKNI